MESSVCCGELEEAGSLYQLVHHPPVTALSNLRISEKTSQVGSRLDSVTSSLFVQRIRQILITNWILRLACLVHPGHHRVKRSLEKSIRGSSGHGSE